MKRLMIAMLALAMVAGPVAARAQSLPDWSSPTTTQTTTWLQENKGGVVFAVIAVCTMLIKYVTEKAIDAISAAQQQAN